jgi:hypothetical protein
MCNVYFVVPVQIAEREDSMALLDLDEDVLHLIVDQLDHTPDVVSFVF